MERDSLVAINILNKEDKICNKSGVPMLYYWNGQNDVLDDLSNDNDLLFYAQTLFESPEMYLGYSVNYFYFKYNDNDEEEYADNIIELQDIIKLNKFDSNEIILYFLTKHFKTLYKNSFKTEFELSDDTIQSIVTMYRNIKDKFKSRLNKETIINWVRSVLIDKDHFNRTNSDYIILKLNEILKSEE